MTQFNFDAPCWQVAMNVPSRGYYKERSLIVQMPAHRVRIKKDWWRSAPAFLLTATPELFHTHLNSEYYKPNLQRLNFPLCSNQATFRITVPQTNHQNPAGSHRSFTMTGLETSALMMLLSCTAGTGKNSSMLRRFPSISISR